MGYVKHAELASNKTATAIRLGYLGPEAQNEETARERCHVNIPTRGTNLDRLNAAERTKKDGKSSGAPIAQSSKIL